jgi:hypothetical protein
MIWQTIEKCKQFIPTRAILKKTPPFGRIFVTYWNLYKVMQYLRGKRTYHIHRIQYVLLCKLRYQAPQYSVPPFFLPANRMTIACVIVDSGCSVTSQMPCKQPGEIWTAEGHRPVKELRHLPADRCSANNNRPGGQSVVMATSIRVG